MSASPVEQLRPREVRRERPGRPDDLPLSPELVLVDPELARWARAQLPDIGGAARAPRRMPAPTERGAVEPFPLTLLEPPAPMPLPEASSPRRRSRLLAGASLVLAFAAGTVVGAKVFDNTTSGVAEQTGSPTASAPAQTQRQPTRTPGSSATKQTSKTAKPKPAAGAIPLASVRNFSWVAMPAAAYYTFSLYRGNERVFLARPREARLTLPASWRYRGHRFRLRPGPYRWAVRPALHSGSSLRLGRAIVSARLTVGR